MAFHRHTARFNRPREIGCAGSRLISVGFRPAEAIVNTNASPASDRSVARTPGDTAVSTQADATPKHALVITPEST